jgi:hypothetical protein
VQGYAASILRKARHGVRLSRTLDAEDISSHNDPYFALNHLPSFEAVHATFMPPAEHLEPDGCFAMHVHDIDHLSRPLEQEAATHVTIRYNAARAAPGPWSSTFRTRSFRKADLGYRRRGSLHAGASAAFERATDPLHCAWINAKLFGNNALSEGALDLGRCDRARRTLDNGLAPLQGSAKLGYIRSVRNSDNHTRTTCRSFQNCSLVRSPQPS